MEGVLSGDVVNAPTVSLEILTGGVGAAALLSVQTLRSAAHRPGSADQYIRAFV